MKTKSFGALSVCAATLAVMLCGLTAVMHIPTPVEIVMIVVALLLLATAGGLIGAAIAAQKKSGV